MPAKKKDRTFVPKVEDESIREAESLEAKPELTVNGKPVPAEWAHLINYNMTDQGIAEAKAQADEQGRPVAQVTRDEWDNKIDRKLHAAVWDSFDPMKEAVDAVRQPGMAYRFLSDRVLERRGRREWEPVLDKSGKAVTVGRMKLGCMPQDYADKRNEHYRAVGNEKLEHAAEEFEVLQAQAIRDAKVSGIQPLRAGEMVADNHAHPGMVTPVGVDTQRGRQ